jgi:NADH dehydrogenase [ubiquinone] 1 alpha subcomplex assembly factor 1
MKTLIITSVLLLFYGNLPEINFGSTGNTAMWYAVNDGVMGGLSSGTLKETKKSMIFSGHVSLENNGGFASIRSKFDRYKLSKFTAVEIKYKSQDYDFAMMLEMNRMFYMPYFKFNLPNSQNKWKTVTIGLEEFEAYSLGKKLGYGLDENSKNDIIRLGFISNEKRAGKYEIEIDYIKFK